MRLDARARAQDVEIVGDLGGELVELVLDLVAAERGEALQAQVEDRARLHVGEPVGAVGRELVARIVDQRDQRARRPAAGQSRAISASRASFASFEARISADHLVDIGDRDGEADQHVGAVARLVEAELGAAGDDLLAERDEGRQQVLQVHHLRTAAVERHHVGAERGSAARVKR